MKGERSPSKRLRNTLFRLWQQEGSKGDFEVYYEGQVEKIITYLKTKLKKDTSVD